MHVWIGGPLRNSITQPERRPGIERNSLNTWLLVLFTEHILQSKVMGPHSLGGYMVESNGHVSSQTATISCHQATSRTQCSMPLQFTCPTSSPVSGRHRAIC